MCSAGVVSEFLELVFLFPVLLESSVSTWRSEGFNPLSGVFSEWVHPGTSASRRIVSESWWVVRSGACCIIWISSAIGRSRQGPVGIDFCIQEINGVIYWMTLLAKHVLPQSGSVFQQPGSKLGVVCGGARIVVWASTVDSKPKWCSVFEEGEVLSNISVPRCIRIPVDSKQEWCSVSEDDEILPSDGVAVGVHSKSRRVSRRRGPGPISSCQDADVYGGPHSVGFSNWETRSGVPPYCPYEQFGTWKFGGLSLQLEVWVGEAYLSLIGQSDHVGVLRRVESRGLTQFLVTYCLGFVVSVEIDESLGLSHFRLARIWTYPCGEGDQDCVLWLGRPSRPG
eukprot:g69861.t1